MEDRQTPRGRHWVMPGMIGIILLGISWSLLEPTAKLIAYLAWMMFAWAGVNFWHHAGIIIANIKNENISEQYRLSETYKAEIISHMNNEQLRAWMRGGQVAIDHQPSKNGTIDYVRGERFFLFTVWYMLRMSTNRQVYPINNFKQETYHFDVWGDHEVDDYSQARAITAYFVRYGWAGWSIGNTAATWTDGHNPETVMAYFGLERDSYPVQELA